MCSEHPLIIPESDQYIRVSPNPPFGPLRPGPRELRGGLVSELLAKKEFPGELTKAQEEAVREAAAWCAFTC
jgi:hypothetical protein